MEKPVYPGLDETDAEAGWRGSPADIGYWRGGSMATIQASDLALVVEQLALAEPQRQLVARRLGRIRGVDQVAQATDAKVAADGSRIGLVRHGGAHQAANGGDRIGPLQGNRGHRPRGDELDQPGVEELPGVDGVMPLGHLARDGQQAQANDLQALPLEARHDLTDEAALNAVGLDQDEGAFHGTRLLLLRGWAGRV